MMQVLAQKNEKKVTHHQQEARVEMPLISPLFNHEMG
jgi:hypothetical protein